jgi:hypothetical protein
MNVVVIRTAEGIIVGLDRSMLRLMGQSVWAESKLLVSAAGHRDNRDEPMNAAPY